jgi:hypothetical protein
MKIEFLVNPIRIHTTPFGRIEYVQYADGRKIIYAVKHDPDALAPVGTVSAGEYKPKGTIMHEIPDTISSKDEQLWKISRQLAKRYRFMFEFLQTYFRNADPYTTNVLEGELGLVINYLYGQSKEVRFGPLVKIFTRLERTKDVNSFVEELKTQIKDLYEEPKIFQTREKGSSILREL